VSAHLADVSCLALPRAASHCLTLPHTASHCLTLPHAASRCLVLLCGFSLNDRPTKIFVDPFDTLAHFSNERPTSWRIQCIDKIMISVEVLVVKRSRVLSMHNANRTLAT
jgi:hypothetical protein